MAALRLYWPLIPFTVWLGFRATAPSRLAAVETAVGTLLLLGAIAVMSTAPRPDTRKHRLLPVVVAPVFWRVRWLAFGRIGLHGPNRDDDGVAEVGRDLANRVVNHERPKACWSRLGVSAREVM